MPGLAVPGRAARCRPTSSTPSERQTNASRPRSGANTRETCSAAGERIDGRTSAPKDALPAPPPAPGLTQRAAGRASEAGLAEAAQQPVAAHGIAGLQAAVQLLEVLLHAPRHPVSADRGLGGAAPRTDPTLPGVVGGEGSVILSGLAHSEEGERRANAGQIVSIG